MVKKHDDSWRMCVDYSDLNKACPIYYYPLPKIDQKVESLQGFKLKFFLNAYKGYHQILMSKEDEEKTAYYTDHGAFCYAKNLFILMNIGVTYQCLVESIFAKQIGRNIEVYIDDMVIKSSDERRLMEDVKETFITLEKVKMKLNFGKCRRRTIPGILCHRTRNPTQPSQCGGVDGSTIPAHSMGRPRVES